MLSRPSQRMLVRAAAIVLALLGVLVSLGAAGIVGGARELATRWKGEEVELLAPERAASIGVRLRGAGVLAAVSGAAAALGPGFPLAVWRAVRRDAAWLRGALRRGARRAHMKPAGAAAMGVAIAAFGLLGAAHLGAPIRCDEASAFLRFGSRPIFMPLVDYSSTNNHVVYSLLLRGSVAALGEEPWAMRLPALLAGAAMIPLVYLAGRAHFGRGVGLVAACAAAPLPYFVDFAASARGYTLMTALLLVVVAVLPRMLRRDGRGWGVFFAASVLGMWTIPVFAYGLAGCGLWLGAGAAMRGRAVVVRTAGRLAVFGGAAVVAVLALYGPALVLSGGGAAEHIGVIGERRASAAMGPWEAATGAVVRLVEVGEFWAFGVPIVAGLVAAAGLVWHLARSAARPRRRSPLVWCALAALVGMTAVTGVPLPPWSYFYLLPIVLLGACDGLADAARWRRWPRWTPAAAGIAATAGIAVVGARDLHRGEVPWLVGYDQAAQVVAELEPRLRAGASLRAAPVAAAPLRYYVHAAGLDVGEATYGEGEEMLLFLLGEHGSTGRLLRDLHFSGYRWAGEFIRVGEDRVAVMRRRP